MSVVILVLRMAACAALLGGCAATAPEQVGRPTRPDLWLLKVHEVPVSLVEVPRPQPGDAVDVQSQGRTVQVTFRFQDAVRVTPLATSIGNSSPVALRTVAARAPPPPQASLVSLVREGRYEDAQRVLDATDSLGRDNVSLELVSALSDDALAQMAHHREGNLLLERLFEELTSGHVSEDELRQAWLLLAAEAQRRYPTPEELTQTAQRVRVFSHESLGVTNAGAPVTAARRPDGRIAVHVTARQFESRYREDFVTLAGTEYVLDPDELVGVRSYDEGGARVFVPALYLLMLSNADAMRVAWKLIEAGALGFSLGLGALAETSAEATALARTLVACDRAALALGIATSILMEHRYWVLSTFGEEARALLFGVDVLNSALALYGVARVAMAAPRLVNGVRSFYQQLGARARLQRQLGKLSEEEVARLESLQAQMGVLFGELDTVRASRSVAAKPGQTPPETGGKVIPLERTRPPGPEAGAQPVPSEGEELLAATGSDARLVPIRRQSSSSAPTVASVKRPGQDGRPGAVAPPQTSPAANRVTGNQLVRESPGAQRPAPVRPLPSNATAAASANEELTSLEVLAEESSGLREGVEEPTAIDVRSWAAQAENAVARRVAGMPTPEALRYRTAIEALRAATPPQLRDSLPFFLRASAAPQVADPASLLRDAQWLLTRPGLSAEAAQTLAAKVADAKIPLDLAWLRSTRLTTEDLDFLARDPNTPWDLFRRAAAQFDDRATQLRARTRLRGIAGEMVAERTMGQVFPEYRLAGRQVRLPGRHIADYELMAASRLRRAVEVKGWTPNMWREALETWIGAGSPGSEEAMNAAAASLSRDQAMLMKQLSGLISQLKDAASSPRGKPFLAVTSGLSRRTMENLDRFLWKTVPNADVRVISEEEILATSRRLRGAFGLPIELPK